MGGLIWTPETELEKFPSFVNPLVLLCTPIEERLHPHNSWHGYQGATPHCAAYAWLHWKAAWDRSGLPAMNPKLFYRDARKKMHRPPREGASIVSGYYVMKENKWVSNLARIYALEDIRLHILATGPVLVGSEWTKDMSAPNMKASGNILNGHAYLLDGYENGRARVKNSLVKETQWLDLTELRKLRWEAWIAVP